MLGGVEWIIEVEGCDGTLLAGSRGLHALRGLFADLIERLELHPVGDPVWHLFEEPGGVTGLVALSESHLACHSYPEAGYLSLNLYTCRARTMPDWQGVLEEHLGGCEVHVRTVQRGPRAAAENAS